MLWLLARRLESNTLAVTRTKFHDGLVIRGHITQNTPWTLDPCAAVPPTPHSDDSLLDFHLLRVCSLGRQSCFLPWKARFRAKGQGRQSLGFGARGAGRTPLQPQHFPSCEFRLRGELFFVKLAQHVHRKVSHTVRTV